MKIIFDTDPGVDDAMALYFALAHPLIDVVGITTTFGNVLVEQAAVNALYLTAMVDCRIPVTRGVGRPWFNPRKSPPDFIHGVDGLGNLPSRIATSSQLDPRSSAQFIVDMARALPGELTLVAVGPLGNLSKALKLAPELPGLLREVIVMGGTIDEPGNVSPVAEANIWNDPHAADCVFSAGCKLTMVGLDVTHRVVLPLQLFKRLADHHRHAAMDTLHHAVSFYADYYGRAHRDAAQGRGCFGHDVLACIYLVNPELFQLERGRIRVATDGLAQGQTIMSRKDATAYPQDGWGEAIPLTQVCMSVREDACVQVFENTLMGHWLGG